MGSCQLFPYSVQLLNFGLMGWFNRTNSFNSNIKFNHVGVGVDFTIHYITEFKRIKDDKKNNISTETIDNVGFP